MQPEIRQRERETYSDEDSVFVVSRTPFMWNVHDGQQALEIFGRHGIPLQISKESENRGKAAEETQKRMSATSIITSRHEWSLLAGYNYP